MKYLLTTLAMIFMAQCPSPNKERTFEKKTFNSISGQELPYRILFPDNYNHRESYPLIVFLHGSGERGNDNEAQLTHIAPSFLTDNFQEKYPSIILFPQCASEDTWAEVDVQENVWQVKDSEKATPSMESLIELIDQIIQEHGVAKTQIYIAGLSMGGFGTYDILSRRPDLFAAGISICGGGNKRYVYKYDDVSMWVFHGAKDPVVPVFLSQEMAESFGARQMDYKYTEYPEGAHDVWNQAWAEPDLLPWLFSKKKQVVD
jgi:predicted peptidase